MGIQSRNSIKLIRHLGEGEDTRDGGISGIAPDSPSAMVSQEWIMEYLQNYLSYLGSLDSAYDTYHKLEVHLRDNFTKRYSNKPKWDTSPLGVKFHGFRDYKRLLGDKNRKNRIQKNLGDWRVELSLNGEGQMALMLRDRNDSSKYLTSVFTDDGGPYFRFTDEGWNDDRMRLFYYLLLTNFINGGEEFTDFLVNASTRVEDISS